MTWYTNSKTGLDYSKPIIAKEDGMTYLLVPVTEPKTYKVVGYNWLNLDTGRYNSCATWANAYDAVNAYRNYDVSNAEFKIEG